MLNFSERIPVLGGTKPVKIDTQLRIVASDVLMACSKYVPFFTRLSRLGVLHVRLFPKNLSFRNESIIKKRMFVFVTNVCFRKK